MAELNPKKLLTDFLIEVGNEQTETITDADGLPIMVTKAEALARTLYLMALGGHQERKLDDGTVQIRDFKPCIAAMKLIREYTEGRPSTNKPEELPGGTKRPGQFDKDAGNRLARVLRTDVAESVNKTRTSDPVPKYPRLGVRPKNGTSVSEKA
jgi:hypothetical protein